MKTRPQHPIVEAYFADLRLAAARLPRQQRNELLAEVRSHLDDGLAESASDADVLNMLDSLGSPDDIVAASTPEGAERTSTGQLALAIAAVALVLVPTIVGSVVLGIVAIVLGVQARRVLRSAGRSTTSATAAIVLGAIAIVITVLAVGVVVLSDSQ